MVPMAVATIAALSLRQRRSTVRVSEHGIHRHVDGVLLRKMIMKPWIFNDFHGYPGLLILNPNCENHLVQKEVWVSAMAIPLVDFTLW